MLATMLSSVAEEHHGIAAGSAFGGRTLFAVLLGAAADAYGYALMGIFDQTPVCNATGIFLASSVVGDGMWNLMLRFSGGASVFSIVGSSIGGTCIASAVVVLVCGQWSTSEEASCRDRSDNQMTLVHPNSMVSRKEYGAWRLTPCGSRAKPIGGETAIKWKDILTQDDAGEDKVPSDSSYRSRVDSKHVLLRELDSGHQRIVEVAPIQNSVDAIHEAKPINANDDSQDSMQKADGAPLNQAVLSSPHNETPSKDEGGSISSEKSAALLKEIEELKQAALKQMQLQQQASAKTI
ncbi:hypothetical protein BJ742DRAFT_774436 [Cladochytrium replicatum]|nr:hypothetical protein BJ742DRAFT_774436 [Cladochytrium replicatum]